MKAKMLEALKQIREQPNPRFGICHQLALRCSDENTDYWRSKLQGLFRRWPQVAAGGRSFQAVQTFRFRIPRSLRALRTTLSRACGTGVLSTDKHVGTCWSFVSLNLRRS